MSIVSRWVLVCVLAVAASTAWADEVPAAAPGLPAAAPAAAAETAAAPTAPLLIDADKISAGDTAWMLTSTALVLMMCIPGLALFYGGMVRKKNILATVMQSFAMHLPGDAAVVGGRLLLGVHAREAVHTWAVPARALSCCMHLRS